MVDKALKRSVAGLCLAALAAMSAACGSLAGQGGGVTVDADDIGGVVRSGAGPEAGVWVVAETRELPTKYIKIVVTDDNGRYVLPDLPKATYDVWVRGYGLVDSAKVTGQPGQTLNLTAVPAPNAAAAAEYYPANYWYALLQPPPSSDFPGTGATGNGIGENMKSQAHWLGSIKMTFSCTQCHQLGTKVTREISPALGTFANSRDAWEHRLQVGISGAFMNGTVAPLGRPRALQVFADWTDRIAKGELPQVPPRPQGLERNVVITQWEVGDEKSFVHDVVSTAKANPTLNANGLVYGTQELSGDYLTVLNPSTNEVSRIEVPLHDPEAPYAWAQTQPQPSPFWGDEIIWKAKVAPHNAMFDLKGRLIISARGMCRIYDPAAKKWSAPAACQGTHHVHVDRNNVAWFNAGGANSFDLNVYDQTGDDKKAAARYDIVLDTNGNGKADPLPPRGTAPGPNQDTPAPLGGFAYTIMPNPADDNTVWLPYLGIPGGIVRVDVKTRLSEVYEPPFQNPASKVDAYLPHGLDVDTTGVVWVALNSGHLAAFDRKKCKTPFNPKAQPLGQQCVEGWTLNRAPGPQFKGVTAEGSADSYYLNWVDQFDTSGLGKDVPFLNGSGSDSIMALIGGRFVTYRVPYPLGFMSRGMDGRIDNAGAGWKGRGVWTAYAAQPVWHQEGGKGQFPKVVKMQFRSNPLEH